MFKNSRSYFLVITGLILFISQLTVSAQDGNQSIKEVKQASLKKFQAGDYESALPGFRLLIDNAPSDAMYRYYTGACQVELNLDMDEAIVLLYFASSRGAPSEVYYYLGTAYHREYNFSEAQRFYEKFERTASRQELKKYPVKHLINTCRSARDITASYNPYEVINVTFMDLYDSTQFTQIKMKGGNLVRKSEIYFRADENRDDLNSLMFMPKVVNRGEYIYYAGDSRNGKEGTQLYRVRKGNGRSWGDPEEIRILNTGMNEILPYYDPIEHDLYFASDGRDGIGGYDLYRSHYDQDRDSWSEAINLGFPVNSTMDDYLLLPGSDLGMVMFFTTRQQTNNMLTVYRVHLIEPKKATAANASDKLKEISYLGGVAADALAEINSLNQEEEVAELPDKNEHGNITPVRIAESENREITAVSEYQLTLSDALKHQAVSDSLKDLAVSARVRIRDSDDPNDRWVWQKQIMVWDKKARDEEELADKLYARMEEEKLNNQVRNVIPESIQADTVINDITIYRYTETALEEDIGNQSSNVIEGEPGSEAQVVRVREDENKAHPEVIDPAYINRFDILNACPYTIQNPIPLDVILPSGSFYRVQLGAFGASVAPDAFMGLSPITGESIPERGLFKYYVGKFTRYSDASTALSSIRSAGYEDAFIVAWYNGTLMATNRAIQLE